MKERPILFSGPMVRAILDGRKTQTRRIMKRNSSGRVQWKGKQWHIQDENAFLACPYGQPGDRLWVKETWQCAVVSEGIKGIGYKATYDDERNWFKAKTGPEWDRLWDKHQDKWRPSIFMPRWASRITLEIAAVRVERLQEISEADAKAEGVTWRSCEDFEPVAIPGPYGPCSGPARIAFKELWDSINAKTHPWASNPWVWVVEFRTL